MNEDPPAHVVDAHLQQLIEAGAGLYTIDAQVTRALAAAYYGHELFWHCELWPENEFAAHFMRPVRLVLDGGNINIMREGRLFGTIAPLEPEERQAARWDRWHAGTDPDVRRLKSFVAALKAEQLTIRD